MLHDGAIVAFGTPEANGTPLAVGQTMALRSSVSEPFEDDIALDWTLALAGGEGTRMQEYMGRRFGTPIPKQYCRLPGGRSVLEHTLDRMNSLTPASRTMTVIGTDHTEWARPQLAGRSDHIFCQPSSRDTAVALYVGIAMIMRWHPNAIITIAPTDHYVAPVSRYLAAIMAARAAAAKLQNVVMLGVVAAEADPDLGYVVLGNVVSGVDGVHRVAAFVDQPSAAGAAKLHAGGALRSTAVACGSVAAFWELGRSAEPQLLDILDSLVPLIGTDDEADAIDYIYRTRMPVSFGRDICERGAQQIAAMPVTDIEWSDLGNPAGLERVMELVARSADC